MFDPFECDPLEVSPARPVMATIADDLGDIYNDLIEGLALYSAGQSQNALWHWHFTYYAHWGQSRQWGLSRAKPKRYSASWRSRSEERGR